MAFTDLNRQFSQWVVIEPELLQIGQFTNLVAQLNNIVETQIKSDQMSHFENLWQHIVKVHLTQMKCMRFLGSDGTGFDFVMV